VGTGVFEWFSWPPSARDVLGESESDRVLEVRMCEPPFCLAVCPGSDLTAPQLTLRIYGSRLDRNRCKLPPGKTSETSLIPRATPRVCRVNIHVAPVVASVELTFTHFAPRGRRQERDGGAATRRRTSRFWRSSAPAPPKGRHRPRSTGSHDQPTGAAAVALRTGASIAAYAPRVHRGSSQYNRLRASPVASC
jgi:hypothetical protein